MMKKMIWLVLLAATTTIAAAQPQQGRGQRQGKDQRGPRGDRQERMVEALDLSDQQQETIKGLRVQYRKSVKSDADALRLKKVQLESEATNDSPRTAEINKLTDEIGALQTKLLKARVKHQIEVRSQLDDEQKMKFDTMHRKRRDGGGKNW